jgi:YD repeat-containing protein
MPRGWVTNYTEFQYPDGHSLFYNDNTVGPLTDLTSNRVDGQHPAALLNSIHYNSAGAVDYALYGNNRELRRGYRPSTGQMQYQEIRDQVNPSYSETCSYDNLCRLVHADTSVWTAEWTYDRYGNRLSQTTTGVSYSETFASL